MNPYIADILAQPGALRDAVKNYSSRALRDLRKWLLKGDFDRIIITGMGSSYNSAYPAVIQLSTQAVPVQFVNTAELLHSLSGMIGPRSLLWMNSQSGESAELVHLLEKVRTSPPACSLAFVNEPSSTLALDADVTVPIHAGPEATVSTKTYVNMLALNLLAASDLAGADSAALAGKLLLAADAMERYLAGREALAEQIDRLLGDFEDLFILGRGSSMSAVWNGSLINKEAAKCAFEGMHSADFRHGPLELVSPGFAALIFAGSSQAVPLNRELALEMVRHGGRVLWVDTVADPDLPGILLPETEELARPIVEILPLQLLTIVMARRKGLEPGQFRYVSKVTARE